MTSALRRSLPALLDIPFTDPQPPQLGLSLATVLLHHGDVVAERYGPGVDADTTLISWSTAKSITHALTGILVRQARLDVHAPAPVPEWSDPSDPRHAITVDHLLRMSSGLHFVEDYVDDRISDTIRMLFGDGQEDMAAFAASFPLDQPPDAVWNYSSGTTNIICRILGAIVGDIGSFMAEQLFAPLGMASATPKFDTAGTFVGSSYVYATARDFARFGQLYLDGGRDILPPGWVDYARTVTPASGGEYGAHWWIWPGEPAGTFYASGYEGQYIVVVPECDVVLVRLGKTVVDLRPNVMAWMAEVISTFG